MSCVIAIIIASRTNAYSYWRFFVLIRTNYKICSSKELKANRYQHHFDFNVRWKYYPYWSWTGSSECQIIIFFRFHSIKRSQESVNLQNGKKKKKNKVIWLNIHIFLSFIFSTLITSSKQNTDNRKSMYF